MHIILEDEQLTNVKLLNGKERKIYGFETMVYKPWLWPLGRPLPVTTNHESKVTTYAEIPTLDDYGNEDSEYVSALDAMFD